MKTFVYLFSLACLIAAFSFVQIDDGLARNTAKAEFCTDYAESAVEQHRRNLQWGCGYGGSRWSKWWDGHYSWCRDWAAEERTEEEFEIRQTKLRQCARENGIDYRRRSRDRSDRGERRYRDRDDRPRRLYRD